MYTNADMKIWQYMSLHKNNMPKVLYLNFFTF